MYEVIEKLSVIIELQEKLIVNLCRINGAAAVRSNALHVLYNELKTQVNECETVEEVAAIVWPED